MCNLSVGKARMLEPHAALTRTICVGIKGRSGFAVFKCVVGRVRYVGAAVPPLKKSIDAHATRDI